MSGGHKIADETRKFIAGHLRQYLESGGTEGHAVDLAATRPGNLGLNCLIRFKGRKSGKTYVTPLSYGILSGEVLIVGSKGGADEHPSWFLNLIASPEVDFQIATQAYRATWRQLEGDEYDEAWDYMVKTYPFYATYKTRTSRKIPVVSMQPVEEIPVFRPEDLD